MSATAEVRTGTFQVREKCSVEMTVRSDHDLNPGDAVEFQFPNSWLLVTGPSFTRELQSEDPAGEHYVGVAPSAGEGRFHVEIRRRHLPYPGGMVRHGRHVLATLAEGSVPAGEPVRIVYANTYAPYVAGTETVWLRARGEAPEVAPLLTVTSGPAERVRIIAPSGVEPGERFEILIVSLDEFDNRSSTEFRGETLVTTDGKTVAEGLDFLGGTKVPVTLESGGVYRFRMRDAVSNAVRVGKGRRGPYWGDIHIHTALSHDGQGNDPYGYARDVSGLDFAAVADHWESLGEAGCGQVLNWAREAHVPGEFVTMLADERNPPELTGHHNVYFRDEQHFLACAAKPGRGPLDLGSLDPSAVTIVPHHTGMGWRDLGRGSIGSAIDLDACDDRGLRPVVEIYSHHGQSELYAPQHVLSYEFNRMRNPERRANTSVPGPYYAQDYWMSGRRLGAIASSDEHSGQGGRRHGGIAAVWAEELTRGAVFDAIRRGRCCATTGERILVEFSADGVEMGGRGRREKGKKLPIRLRVWGTATLLRVEILRHRFGLDSSFAPILSEAPRPESMDACLELEDTAESGCVYYARVTQEPLDWPGMAWTSPVWIDV